MGIFQLLRYAAGLLIMLLLPAAGWAASNQVSTADFTDIKGHWARQSIEKVTALGYDQGFPDHTFRPQQPLTLLEAVQKVLQAAGFGEQIAKLKQTKQASALYAVPQGQNYINFAVQQNFLPADLLQQFRHDRPVNRGQLAVLLASALYLPPVDGGGVAFTDSQAIPPAYLPAVRAVVSQGIMSGFPDGTFRPQHQVSRGEMAALLAKLYDQGWLKTDAKRKVEGWVAAVAPGKNGLEIQINSLKGTQKITAAAGCPAYWQGHPVPLQQVVNYRVAGILDSQKKLAYLELLERRSFSPVQRDTYASYLRHAEGEPVVITVKDMLNEEVDYAVAWDAEIRDDKAKGKTGKDLLKKLKAGQFIKLGLTADNKVQSITLPEVKNITGEVDRINRALYLKKNNRSSKKYVPDHFWGWDFGRLVDKQGNEIDSLQSGDKVKIFYIGEPFYERVLEIQKLN
ncbi:S-layer homology domain-containing protein [Desulforamulus hydrothermalis]|uniref:S-layer domain protein n=1 Tax=Desulforamulus hydrothermalis Lam5 = DSM 18033 TaxID=1121428 RepID=K8EC22_9FIRM|nr:S-layer homology domain-containing protein [Desulforamulus hydrothermalis]CCO09248.1 S-layer domain protein [Desulforamulus hydrothermalis Lam5 = DSM 18033]SHH05670.1 S-layer homology domain-containing protein [Desulforamulus hydrothermalis Lam5 = DSM 18033]